MNQVEVKNKVKVRNKVNKVEVKKKVKVRNQVNQVEVKNKVKVRNQVNQVEVKSKVKVRNQVKQKIQIQILLQQLIQVPITIVLKQRVQPHLNKRTHK